MSKTPSVFNIEIQYDTQNYTGLSKVFEVWSTSVSGAKQKASRIFHNDSRRRNSRITRMVHVGGEVPVVRSARVAPVAGGQYALGGSAVRVEEVTNRFVVFTYDGVGVNVMDRQRFMDSMRPRQPVVTYKWFQIYPNDRLYVKEYGPVTSSDVGLDKIIQIKATYHDGKLVNKEIV